MAAIACLKIMWSAPLCSTMTAKRSKFFTRLQHRFRPLDEYERPASHAGRGSEHPGCWVVRMRVVTHVSGPSGGSPRSAAITRATPACHVAFTAA
jgi:hypothetical protein